MANRKVIIRVDGNAQIGLGHIYRGIAIAEMLKENFDIQFITQLSSTISPIIDAGFNYSFLPENLEIFKEPEWYKQNIDKNCIILLDGYNFTEDYQQKIKNISFKLVYIDDLAIGTQKADLVINHSPGIKKSDYKCESYTRLALGLDYALIRQSFINFDRSNVKSNNDIKTILVSFGGADPKDFTYKTVVELLKKEKIEQINVILGAAYKHVEIKEIKSKKIKTYNNLSEKQVFDIMKNSDIAIVPASTTSIELASLGVPMLLGYFIDNQKTIYNGFCNAKSVICIGNFNENFNLLIDKLNDINIENYSSKLLALFNGSPNINIINQIKELC